MTIEARQTNGYSSYVRKVPGSLTSRFIIEASSGSFPSRFLQQDDVPLFSLTGDDQAKVAARSLLVSLGERRRGDDQAVICEAGGQIASAICASGIAMYEVGHDLGSSKGRGASRFDEFAALISSRLHSRRSTKALPVSWATVMPTELGGYFAHRRLLSDLDRVDEIMPRYRTALVRGSGYDSLDRNFDLGMYQRASSEFFANRLAGWGWSPSSAMNAFISEYFHLHRWMVSKRAKVILRDHVHTAMNELLELVVTGVTIERQGGRTLQQYDAKLQELEVGSVSTKDAIDWLSRAA